MSNVRVFVKWTWGWSVTPGSVAAWWPDFKVIVALCAFRCSSIRWGWLMFACIFGKHSGACRWTTPYLKTKNNKKKSIIPSVVICSTLWFMWMHFVDFPFLRLLLQSDLFSLVSSPSHAFGRQYPQWQQSVLCLVMPDAQALTEMLLNYLLQILQLLVVT